MRKRYKILTRHFWVEDCTITESINLEKEVDKIAYRKFTATIKGWRNFLIYEGRFQNNMTPTIIKRVREIKKRIENGDENVFKEDLSLFSIS